jgi:ABC-type sugar transport system substrate-binding protein
MERIDHLLFSLSCGLAMGVFWGGVVALFHVKAGLYVGLVLGLLTFAFFAKMYKEWWADEADLGVASQDGKAV